MMSTYKVETKVCVRGHDLTDEKVARLDRRGKKACRVCDADRKRADREKSGDVCLPPATKAVLVNYKEPLRPVEGGFGYLGTLAYDESKIFTQCHICGFFYKHLHKHIRQLHEMDSDEYKDKFGLQKKTSLLATNTRSNYLDFWEKLAPDEKAKRLKHLKEIAARGRANREYSPRGRALEWYNKKGNCPDQIIDKILKLSEKLGRTIGIEDFQKEHGRGFVKAAQHHFGSWTEALREAGLTPLPRHGRPWYTEEFLIESLRNFAKMYGRQPYYSDTNTNLLPGHGAYQRCFGGWTKAKQAAFGVKDS